MTPATDKPEAKQENSRLVRIKLPGITIVLPGPLSVLVLVVLLLAIGGIFYLMITNTGPGMWASAALWLLFIVYWNSVAKTSCADQQLRVEVLAPTSSAPYVWCAAISVTTRAWTEAALVADVSLDCRIDWLGDTSWFGAVGSVGPTTPWAKLERSDNCKNRS
jgi:hypothetical protein